MDFLEQFTAKKFNVFLSLILLTALVYAPVMRGDYVFDDDLFIVNNQYVHDLDHVKQIYTHSATDGAGVAGGNFYRPNQSLCQAAIYTIVGKGPEGQHVFSILIHILNTCLLFVFLSMLGFSNLAAFIVAVIFGIHPIHTEAVSYISGLSDPLCMLFILLSCISYLSYQKEKKWIYGLFVLVCVLGALFSKESGIALFVVMILLAWYLKPSRTELHQGEKVLLGVVTFLCLGFLYLKFTVFNFTGSVSLSAADDEYTGSLWVRFITFCSVFPRYMGMLIFPIDQYIEKPYAAYVSFIAIGVGGLMMLGALGYLFYQSFRSGKTLMLAIGIFFAFLLPVSGIIPTNAIYLEHWLYLPFLGVAIAFAFLFGQQRPKWRTPLTLLFFAMLIAYSAKTIYRNTQWADAVKFYKNEIRYNKRSARIYNNLAMVLKDKGDLYGAATYYNYAISVYDAYPQTHHNLALTYLALNQVSEAIAEEYKALKMQPDFMYSLQSLFDIYTALKDEKRAAAFTGYMKQVQEGQRPDWNSIKENLHADKP
jgi:hypothetical protein